MKKLELHVLLSRQKTLNQNLTLAERQFQSRLRRHKIQHKSQQLIGPFIADFVIPRRMLVIEVDGGVHLSRAAQEYDAQRTRYLESQGFSVLRLTNDQVKTWPLSRIDAYPELMGKNRRLYKTTVGRLMQERNHPGEAMSLGPVVC